MRLYKRIAALTIWRARPDAFFTAESNAIVVTDLRIRFSCEKNHASEPNKCQVTVTNLADATRSALEHAPLMARLDAGYLQADGTRQLSRIFSGDVRRAFSRKDGTDWDTTLQVADGHRGYRYGHVSQTFRAGSTGADVAKVISGAMGLASIAPAALARLAKVTFVKGKTMHGPAHREMTKLIDAVPSMVPGAGAVNTAAVKAGVRLRWSIQDGQLQILGDDEVRPGEAIVVSQDTGMVGSPEYGTPTESGKPPTLTVKSLLYSAAAPGGRMKLVSESINGFFRLEKVKHLGDTRDKDWYTEIEARPL